jgi:hypothetical protein
METATGPVSSVSSAIITQSWRSFREITMRSFVSSSAASRVRADVMLSARER